MTSPRMSLRDGEREREEGGGRGREEGGREGGER